MLQRAKSFIHRSKREEEKHKESELDLSETSHLRRNVSINREVLEQQIKLSKSRENLNDRRSKKLERHISRSQEVLHDQVLEQIRRINFGDSYSKKDAQKLSQTKESFQKGHPAYISEKKLHRRSGDIEDIVQRFGKTDKHVPHRTSGDVVSNFDRKNVFYGSDRLPNTVKQETENPLLLNADDDFLLNRKSVNMSFNFDRRSPGYISGRNIVRKKSDVLEKSGLRNLFQKIKGNWKSGEKEFSDTSSFSEGSTGSSTASFGYEKKDHHTDNSNSSFPNSGSCSNTSTASSSASVRQFEEKLNYVINKQDAASDNNSNFSSKPGPFTRNGLMYSSERSASHDPTIITVNNVGIKTIFDKNHPSYYSKENYAQTENHHLANQTHFVRGSPVYSSENKIPQRQNNVFAEESSRKRSHNQTKPNFDGNKLVSTSQRLLHTDSRKKAFDRIKHNDDTSNNR